MYETVIHRAIIFQVLVRRWQFVCSFCAADSHLGSDQHMHADDVIMVNILSVWPVLVNQVTWELNPCQDQRNLVKWSGRPRLPHHAAVHVRRHRMYRWIRKRILREYNTSLGNNHKISQPLVLFNLSEHKLKFEIKAFEMSSIVFYGKTVMVFKFNLLY